MRDLPRLLFLVLILIPAPAARADEARAGLAALQEAVRNTVRDAGPSVACIYVSRSPAYHRARYWGVAPAEDATGHLGRFDAAAAAKKVPADAPNRARILRTIRDHDLSSRAAVPESYGSGVVVDKSGLILTNAHVVKHATKVYVRLPGGRGSWADIHASDPRSDLAVLRLLDKVPGLKAPQLGDGEKVRNGDFIIALCNSFAPGFRDGESTAKWGMVSALRAQAPGDLNEMQRHARHKITLHHYGTLIQTDAAVAQGCSGGILLNLAGKVVGLTTALANVRGGESAGAQAVPLDEDTCRIIEVLKRGEEVEYGFLGVVLTGDRRWGGGAWIAQISPASPASRAGLQPEDRILAINGKPVRDSKDLFLLLGMNLAGRTAKVEIKQGHGGGRRTLDIKLAKFYVPGPVIASRRPPARGGLRVDYLSILSQSNPFGLWRRVPPEGVIVREVISGSAADKAHLQPDKIITHVDGEPVKCPADYYRVMEKAKGRVELTVLDSDNRPERITLDLR
jgi:serine protease Do